MKTNRKIISIACTALTLASIAGIFTMNNNTAEAQSSNQISATHMWVRADTNIIYIPATSLAQCEILTQQAALLNSTESNCYSGKVLLREIKCIKPLKNDSSPKCS